MLLLLLLLFILDNCGTFPSLAFRVPSFKNRRYSHCGDDSSAYSVMTMQQTESSSSSSSSSFRLGYITDVEGNLEYFKSFVRQSHVLDLVVQNDDDNDTTTIELTLRDDGDGDNCYFVYGGDVVDKGPGDIRLCRALVKLKQKYPDRVVLLVGNRDLNKLRFAAELSAADMNRPLDDITPPHWDPDAPTLRQYLESIIMQKQDKFSNDNSSSNSSSSSSSSSSSTDVEQLNTLVNRLQYMLLHTLGCPQTFEFRQQKLSILSRKAGPENITDNQVVQSFLDEVQEGGSLLEYLEHGQVAAVIGNTLFVHGAVDVNTMKFVPSNDSKFENPKSKPAPGKLINNVEEWVKELNQYLKHGLEDYKKRRYWDGTRTTRGGESRRDCDSSRRFSHSTLARTGINISSISGKDVDGAEALLSALLTIYRDLVMRANFSICQKNGLIARLHLLTKEEKPVVLDEATSELQQSFDCLKSCQAFYSPDLEEIVDGLEKNGCVSSRK